MRTEIHEQPLVSVVTPVYNGEKYLEECIESVLAQTYSNWEYVIVNNRSTDRTLEIAERYAARDDRIRIHDNAEFLDLMPNWNHAMRQISPESRYCKVVHADDWIFPDCIGRMVEVAEANPSVGLVGAYRERRGRIDLEGIARDRTVVPGREVVAAFFHAVAELGGYRVFGTPSSTMIRADLIRAREQFYNPANELHADTETCCEVLRDSDFGFVHEVLTTTRMHVEQATTRSFAIASIPIEELGILIRFGREVLDEDDYARCVQHAVRIHDRVLAGALLQQRPKGFWGYHLRRRRELGHRLRVAGFCRAIAAEAIDLMTHPNETWQRVRRRSKASSRAAVARSS